MQKIYINKDKCIAIVIDDDNKLAMSYDLLDIAPDTVEYASDMIDYSSEGILKELDTEIFQDANKELHIDIKDYGVTEINCPHL